MPTNLRYTLLAAAILMCVGLPRIAHASLIADAANGDLAAVKSNIAAHADVNAKDSSGGTALIGAADFGHADCVKALIAPTRT